MSPVQVSGLPGELLSQQPRSYAVTCRIARRFLAIRREFPQVESGLCLLRMPRFICRFIDIP